MEDNLAKLYKTLTGGEATFENLRGAYAGPGYTGTLEQQQKIYDSLIQTAKTDGGDFAGRLAAAGITYNPGDYSGITAYSGNNPTTQDGYQDPFAVKGADLAVQQASLSGATANQLNQIVANYVEPTSSSTYSRPSPYQTTQQTYQPIQQTTQAPVFNWSGTYLKQGVYNNDEVKQLQGLLGITADGDFGPITRQAVMDFQRKNGLTVDGIVGPQTAAALNKQGLPTAQAPTTASGVTTMGGVNMPTVNAGAGNIFNALASTAGTSSYIETQQKIAEERQRQIEAQQKALQTSTQPLLERLLGSKSPTGARADATEDSGIAELRAQKLAKIAEIESLTQEYNATKAAMEAQIAQSYDKLGSNNFINNQIAQIQRNAAPKLNMLSANINAKAATLQVLQGDIAAAQDAINQAVQDATAEFKYNYDVFSMFYEMNRDILTSLDAPYQQAYESALEFSRVQYEQQLNEKTMVGEMMIDPALRGSGILITDTYEEALTKAQAVAGTNYLADKAKTGTGTSAGTSGFKNADIESDVRADAAELLYNEGLTPEEAYKRLRTAYSTVEVSDTALKSLVGLSSIATPQPTSGVVTSTGQVIPQPTYEPYSKTGTIGLGGAFTDTVINGIKNFLYKLR